MNSLREYLNESILDPIQDQLSPDLWDKNQKMLRSAKTHMIKRLENWLSGNTSKRPKKLYVLGSMAGYQYTSTSDIDINFVLDVSAEQRDSMIKKMMVELNEKPLPGTKHPVNYYFDTEFRPRWKTEGGLYEMYKDTWVSKPKEVDKSTVVSSFRATTEISRFFIAGLDLMISEYHSDVAAYEAYKEYLNNATSREDKKDLQQLINIKLQEIVADIDGVYIAKHMIWALRKEAFDKDEGRKEAFDKDEGLEINTVIDIKDNANNSINNLIYKYVEKLGYFNKIKKILDESDKWNKELQTG
jgi:hypothetical protein